MRSRLAEFWAKHYVADDSTLCVVGTQSLSTLEKWTSEAFGPIGHSPIGITHSQEDASESVWPDAVRGSRVQWQSVSSDRSLSLVWALPPQQRQYRHKSLEFLSSLLGSEHQGGALSVLKRKGWANGLSCGRSESTRQFDEFSLDVDLTERGLEHSDSVVSVLLQYSALVCSEGVQAWRYEEGGSLQRQQFELKDKEDPGDFATNLASALHRTPARDILTRDWLWEEFDLEEVKELCARLNPGVLVCVVFIEFLEHFNVY